MMRPRYWPDRLLVLNLSGLPELMGSIAQQRSDQPEIVQPRSISGPDEGELCRWRKLWCTLRGSSRKMGLFRSRDWD